jgi:hypothetical protein
MSNSIYPNAVRGLAWPIMKEHEFATIVQASPAFDETRIIQSVNPVWHWTLIYNYVKNDPNDTISAFTFGSPPVAYTDYQFLEGFLLNHQGQYDDFLFNDLSDNTVTNQTMQLIQDSATGIWYTPVQRLFGGQFYEDVTDLHGSIALKANGVTKTVGACAFGNDAELVGPGLAITGYSFSGLVLKWCGGGSPPTPPAAPITASFQFYFRVRLETDNQDFEQWTPKLWTSGGPKSRNGSGVLKLRTSRTATT